MLIPLFVCPNYYLLDTYGISQRVDIDVKSLIMFIFIENDVIAVKLIYHISWHGVVYTYVHMWVCTHTTLGTWKYTFFLYNVIILTERTKWKNEIYYTMVYANFTQT